jgi:hypothetical protein
MKYMNPLGLYNAAEKKLTGWIKKKIQGGGPAKAEKKSARLRAPSIADGEIRSFKIHTKIIKEN